MFSLGFFLYVLKEEIELVLMKNLPFKGCHHAYQVLKILSVKVKKKNKTIWHLENRIKKEKENHLALENRISLLKQYIIINLC